MKTPRMCLAALVGLAAWLVGSGCGEMPNDDPGAWLEKVTVIALLEPGDSGLQEVLVTQPVDLETAVNDSTTFLPGATVTLRRLSDGAEITLDEDPAGFRYVFDRAAFPLAETDSVELTVSGLWRGETFHAATTTDMVSAAGLAFSEKPNDRSHGLDADTLMIYDPAIEENFNSPNAFHVDYDESADPRSYAYQIEFLAVIPGAEPGTWRRMPSYRLHWLRDDEELAWQVGPYPDLRLPPGEEVRRQPVSWGFFVFVDEYGHYTADSGPDRRLGYYQVTLRRLNDSAARFYYSSHWWIGEQVTDPVDFNLQGERCQGVVGSCARTAFRVAIVDDTPRD